MNTSTVTLRPGKGRLGSRIKSNTGCLSCKARKVKCDEDKPVCRRCLSTGRKCDGYANDKWRTQALAAESPEFAHVGFVSSYANVDRVELQSFEFFISS